MVFLRKQGIKSQERISRQTEILNCNRYKIKAILLIDKGHTLTETAVLLSIEENTVRRWQNHYLKRKNIGQFLSRHCPGYEGKFSEEKRPVVSHYADSDLVSEAK